MSCTHLLALELGHGAATASSGLCQGRGWHAGRRYGGQKRDREHESPARVMKAAEPVLQEGRVAQGRGSSLPRTGRVTRLPQTQAEAAS